MRERFYQFLVAAAFVTAPFATTPISAQTREPSGVAFTATRTNDCIKTIGGTLDPDFQQHFILALAAMAPSVKITDFSIKKDFRDGGNVEISASTADGGSISADIYNDDTSVSFTLYKADKTIQLDVIHDASEVAPLPSNDVTLIGLVSQAVTSLRESKNYIQPMPTNKLPASSVEMTLVDSQETPLMIDAGKSSAVIAALAKIIPVTAGLLPASNIDHVFYNESARRNLVIARLQNGSHFEFQSSDRNERPSINLQGYDVAGKFVFAVNAIGNEWGGDTYTVNGPVNMDHTLLEKIRSTAFEVSRALRQLVGAPQVFATSRACRAAASPS